MKRYRTDEVFSSFPLSLLFLFYSRFILDTLSHLSAVFSNLVIDIRLFLSLYVRFREGNIFFSNYRRSFFLLRYLEIFRVIKWIRIEKFDKSSICFDLFLTIALFECGEYI